MKALILNFNHFEAKDKSKTYYKFDVFDLDSKKVYNLFQNAAFTAVPDGIVPQNNDSKLFPALADITLVVDDYVDQQGITRYRPNVKSINTWKKADIR